jgi:signal transduction histidine kinase/CheY-like chemotaxis protein
MAKPGWTDTLSERSRTALVAGMAAAGMLLIAGLALAFYDSQIYKIQKLKEVTIQAQIMAASVTAPLVFDDADTTREYLNALQVNTEIDAAAIYNRSNALVASFTRDISREVPAKAPTALSQFGDNYLTVVLPVLRGNEGLGTVYVRAWTEPLIRRLARYAGILLLLTMASLVVAVLVTAHNALSRANAQLQARAAELAMTNDQLIIEIKERGKAEDALRQAQKMEAVGQLTGGIAHDFNNMLAIVVGNLSLLLRRAAQGKTDLTRYAEGALEGASRGAKLTQQLLAFSRQQPLAPIPLDPNKLVSSMSELLRRTIGEHIRFETVIAGGIWTIHADKTQLETAVLNLAVNARDAMPDGGTLTIETANATLDDAYSTPGTNAVPGGDYVMIAVTDTGEGMSSETVAKAFDPFFTTKPVGKGTGLGLSQVYGFMKQSRGHVKIYSEIDKGTTVKLYLPRHIGNIAVEKTVAVQTLPQGDAREVILVVEDDDTVRRVAVDSLRELGYTVHHAESASKAVTVLAAHPETVLLFTDIVMPDGNGRKLADDALRMYPNLKVLFTTGYTRDAIVHNGVLDEGVELLPKPYSIDQLAAKIRDVLGPAPER